MSEEDYDFKATAVLSLGVMEDGQICRRIYLDPHPDNMPDDAEVPITHSLIVKVAQFLQSDLASHISDEGEAKKVIPHVYAIEEFERDGKPWVRIDFNKEGEYLILPMYQSEEADE